MLEINLNSNLSHEQEHFLCEEENFKQEYLQTALRTLSLLLYAKRQNQELSKEEERLETLVNKIVFK